MTPEQFWSRVQRGAPDACWLWRGGNGTDGYGAANLNGRTRPAHRIAYELANNITLRREEHVCHACDVKKCVNPNHLWVGSAHQNMRDAMVKGRKGRFDQRSGFGLALARIRTSRNLSIEELGRMIGRNGNFISALERGRVPPDPIAVLCIARVLGLSVDDLLEMFFGIRPVEVCQ